MGVTTVLTSARIVAITTVLAWVLGAGGGGVNGLLFTRRKTVEESRKGGMTRGESDKIRLREKKCC